MINGDKAVLGLTAAVAAATGLGIGILLGAWLGRIGALEVLRTLWRFPLALFRAPGQLKNHWKAWGEWRARRKIEQIRHRSQIKELQGKIVTRQNEIRATRDEIRRARWKFSEPR